MPALSRSGWIRLGLLNLCLVALLGLIMRYKILYELPWLNQRYLLHAHSHFAFTGWIGHVLLVLIGSWLATIRGADFRKMKVYQLLITINLLLSYGLLISFALAGYHLISNLLSFGTVLVNVIFAFCFFRDTRSLKHPSLRWFRAAFWFYMISCLGTLGLAYMLASGQVTQQLYLLAVYFYLHFQYNGWFFFSCIGLLIAWLHQRELLPSKYNDGFRYFMYACPPAFLLSALWLELPLWLIVVVAISALLQLIAMVQLGKRLVHSPALDKDKLKGGLWILLVFTGIALGIKLLLQAGSTIPEVSKLAFGFRHIVIAYLHLVLLCIVSLFLLILIRMEDIFPGKSRYLLALMLFTGFVYLNEATLAVQGIASFSYVSIPGGNQILLIAAAGLFLSTFLLLLNTFKVKQEK